MVVVVIKSVLATVKKLSWVHTLPRKLQLLPQL